MARRLAAEFIGTLLLVFFGAGVATLVFGLKILGPFDRAAVAAGVVAIALTFGLVLLALVYVIGPISGCHVNPAVTLGALLSRRLTIVEAAGYWIVQFIGGFLGALLLYGLLRTSPFYSKARDGLGTNGYGTDSLLHFSGGGAFLVEVVLTAFFVFAVLNITRKLESGAANATTAGLVIGLALATCHLLAVVIDGTSVNPARSLGPALVTGGLPLSQVWLFIVAPLTGAIVAAGLYLLFYPAEIRAPQLATADSEAVAGEGTGLWRGTHPAMAQSAADEERLPAGQAGPATGRSPGGPATAPQDPRPGEASAAPQPGLRDEAAGQGPPDPGTPER